MARFDNSVDEAVVDDILSDSDEQHSRADV